MAYEQVVGRVPFHDTEAPMVILMRHVKEPIPPLVEVRPDVDPALSAWIDRLLVKDPADRTRQALQAWDVLEEIVSGVLGARWRREARLPELGPTTITPLPLTPAPFESQHVPTPPPAPAAPAPESEFLTFGSPSAAEPAAASSPPAAATPPAAAVPEGGATPEAPVAPSQAQPAGPPAAPATPQEDESRFVTFGRTPEPPAAATPSAAAPSAATEPPAAPPVEPPAPPTHGTTWQPAVTPPEPLTAPTPAVGPAPVTVPAPAVAREPRAEPSPRPAGNRRLLVAMTAALLIAAGVGFAVAHSSGGSEASALSGRAAAGPLEVSFPSSWQQQGSVPTTPDISLSGSLALAAPSGGELVLGSATPSGATLLPASLLSALPSAPHGEAVRLGELELYRYRNLQPTGAAVPETLYALGTSSGTVLGVCVPPASGAVAFTAQCEQVLGSLKLTSGSALALGPSQAYATELGSALSALDAVRASAGATLAKAGSAKAQATAATTLAQAHNHAAAAVRAANPGPAEQAANAALAAALARIAGGYSALASAAHSGNTGSYDAARQTVDSGTAALMKAVGELRKLGYE